MLSVVLLVLIYIWGRGAEELMGTYSLGQIGQLCVSGVTFLNIFFGASVSLNTLYLAKDVAYFLALPIRGRTYAMVRLARFTLNNIQMDCMLFVFVIGFLGERAASVSIVVRFVFLFLAAALISTALLGILAMIVFSFTSIARNVSRTLKIVQIVFSLVALVLYLVVILGAQLSSSAIDLPQSGPLHVALIVINPLMLVTNSLVEALGSQLLVALIAGIGMVALYLAATIYCASKQYLRGVRAVQGAGSTSGTSKSKAQSQRSSNKAFSFLPRRAWRSYASFNTKTVLRNTTFLNENVISPIIVPIIMVFCMVFIPLLGILDEQGNLGVSGMFSMVRLTLADFSHMPQFLPIYLAIFCAYAGVIQGMLCYLEMQSISRDGTDFYYLSAMPLNWRDYVFGKLVSGLLFSYVPSFVVVSIVNFVVAGISGQWLAALLAEPFIACAGLPVHLLLFGWGARHPNFDWQSAAELSKGFKNVVVLYGGLLAQLLISAACIAPFAASIIFAVPLFITLPISAGILALLIALSARWAIGGSARSLEGYIAAHDGSYHRSTPKKAVPPQGAAQA